MQYDINIHDSIYKNINKEGKGGAVQIESEDVKIRIFSCIFEEIKTTDSGGSLLLRTNLNDIQDSLFYRTFSSGLNNDVIIGNALYVLSGETKFNNNEVSLCGYLHNECADSSIRFERKCEITNHNASSNCGVLGGAGFALRGESNSIIRFINVIDPDDGYAVENDNLENEFSLINIINSNKCAWATIYLIEDDVLLLKNCTFINSHDPFSHTSNKFKAFDCYSDSSINSISLDVDPQTINVIIYLNFDRQTITCHNNHFIQHNLKINCIIFIIFSK